MAKQDAAADSLETGMLSYARSLQPSEGLFWGTRSGDPKWREPVEVVERGVRGQSSEFKTQNPGKSNLQVVEAASVPPGCDGVALAFGLWITPRALKPWACGKREIGKNYERLAESYKQKGGFRVLAERFLWNIANGRIAWRNRFHADTMRVVVEYNRRAITFDPTRLGLETPQGPKAMAEAVVADAPAEPAGTVDDLVEWMHQGLTEGPRFLHVTWHAQKGEAQEVFPSQEYVREQENISSKRTASRVYAKLMRHDRGRTVAQASMHGQKIGAALRHIDTWHGQDGHDAIAVNPYGGVQETGDVLRKKGRGPSFYELRSKPADLFAGLDRAQTPNDVPGDVHFVVANLVRGGVFGQAGEEA